MALFPILKGRKVYSHAVEWGEREVMDYDYKGWNEAIDNEHNSFLQTVHISIIEQIL